MDRLRYGIHTFGDHDGTLRERFPMRNDRIDTGSVAFEKLFRLIGKGLKITDTPVDRDPVIFNKPLYGERDGIEPCDNRFEKRNE